MSRPIQLADAVVDALNSGSWSRPFRAERHYLPHAELAELAAPMVRVFVVPKSVGSEAADRNSTTETTEIDVAAIERSDRSVASVDRVLALAEEIADYFWAHPVLPCGDRAARVTAVARDPIFAPGHLDTLSVTTCLITLTFRARVQAC